MLSFWLGWVSGVALALMASGLILLLFIRVALVVVTVRSTSMSPTLLDGDRVLVLRHWPTRWLRKGQVVILWPWDFPPQKIKPFGVADPYIKRIVGLPGETLITSLAELKASERPSVQALHDDQGRRRWDIPAEHIFVRGDNPRGSLDSLAWGPVPCRSVLGRVMLKLPRQAVSVIPWSSEPMLEPGQPAPNFKAQTLSGESVTLTRYTGSRVVFVFIFPSTPCQIMLPDIEAWQPKAEQSGIELVLVSLTNARQTRALINGLDRTLPVLVAADGSPALVAAYKIPSTPFCCLVDGQGRVQSVGFPNSEGAPWKHWNASWVAERKGVINSPT